MRNKEEFLQYMREYNKEKRVRISLNLSKETDKDLIETIDQAGGGQKGLKEIIRYYMRAQELEEYKHKTDLRSIAT